MRDGVRLCGGPSGEGPCAYMSWGGSRESIRRGEAGTVAYLSCIRVWASRGPAGLRTYTTRPPCRPRMCTCCPSVVSDSLQHRAFYRKNACFLALPGVGVCGRRDHGAGELGQVGLRGRFLTYCTFLPHLHTCVITRPADTRNKSSRGRPGLRAWRRQRRPSRRQIMLTFRSTMLQSRPGLQKQWPRSSTQSRATQSPSFVLTLQGRRCRSRMSCTRLHLKSCG